MHPIRPIEGLAPIKKQLLEELLERLMPSAQAVPALKFRAENHSKIQSLDELEREGLLLRPDGGYVVSAMALPLLDSPTSARLLSQIELLYGALRHRYLRDQDKPVPVAGLAEEVGLSNAAAAAALQRMKDISTWCAGHSADLLQDQASVTPAEAILNNDSFAALVAQVRSWNEPAPMSPLHSFGSAAANPSIAQPADDDPPDVERELSPAQAKGLLAAVSELEGFRIKPNDYYDDLDSRAFIDNVLTGQLKTLHAYCSSIGWRRLTKQLRELIPQRGEAMEDLDLIQSFIAPEVRRLALVRTAEPKSQVTSEVLPAWPAIRACLQELHFYDIKEVAGLAGLDVTALSHLDQKQQGGASKGQLMTAVDSQYRSMTPAVQARFLTILIEEILRRRPQSEEKLSEYLDRLGWSFVDQTLVPVQVLSPQTFDDTPTECRKDLLKAAQRLRDGDLTGAISAACGAVDSATASVYEEMGLGDPTDASFQEACKKAMQARGVLTSLDQQLHALGWQPEDIQPFRKNLEGALRQGAFVMQTLRSHMGDVHGSKPILRSLVFDCLRWAELIVGSLVDRDED